METKEKLSEIIKSTVVNAHGTKLGEVFHPEFVDNIVGNLMKNDVETVVRCKDCSHYMEMKGYDYNGKKARCCVWHSQLRRENDYCSDGIRKGGEGE